MKVRELIEQLQSMDQDLEVYVNGYEGGINDAESVKFIEVIRDLNEEWYYGNHENVEDLGSGTIGHFLDQGKEKTKGIIIE
jgi:hypothetical protein